MTQGQPDGYPRAPMVCSSLVVLVLVIDSPANPLLRPFSGDGIGEGRVRVSDVLFGSVSACALA
jgi:hypothetical protein